MYSFNLHCMGKVECKTNHKPEEELYVTAVSMELGWGSMMRVGEGDTFFPPKKIGNSTKIRCMWEITVWNAKLPALCFVFSYAARRPFQNKRTRHNWCRSTMHTYMIMEQLVSTQFLLNDWLHHHSLLICTVLLVESPQAGCYGNLPASITLLQRMGQKKKSPAASVWPNAYKAKRLTHNGLI